MKRVAAAVLLMVVAGCARHTVVSGPVGVPPAWMLDRFRDDYGSTHIITDAYWQHGTKNRYHIVKWNPARQYAIARNDAANAGERGRFTRIDWMMLDLAPYRWAFCFTVYDAPSAEAAEKTRPADRTRPRTGCGGYPFTRMAPVDPSPR